MSNNIRFVAVCPYCEHITHVTVDIEKAYAKTIQTCESCVNSFVVFGDIKFVPKIFKIENGGW